MPTARPTGEGTHDDKVVVRAALVRIGRVWCPVDHPAFGRPAVVSGFRIVFPRQAVWIASRGSRFLSAPGGVEFYNDGDDFARSAADPRGDRTDWYGLDESIVREIVRRYDPAAADSRRPFRAAHGRTGSRLHARQRSFAQALAGSSAPGPLVVEETVLAIADATVAAAYDAARARGHVTRRDRELAEAVDQVLARSTRGRVTLGGVAGAVGVSPFHLSRVFRRVTGQSIAKRQLEYRLLDSLEPLLETRAPLRTIAARFGFATHSHYTHAFRRRFGRTPAAVRLGLNRT